MKLYNCSKLTIRHYHGGYQLSVNFIFAVTVADDKIPGCRSPHTLAFASHSRCFPKDNPQRRPMLGRVSICKKGLHSSFRDNDSDFFVQTLKHEMLHALVFSQKLFGRFPGGSKEVLTNKSVNWKSLHNTVTKNFKIIKSKNVKPELMTGAISAYARFTRLTLALMLDSGWYTESDHVDDLLDDLDYGRNKGCMFLSSSCLAYIQYIDRHPEQRTIPSTWCTPNDTGSKLPGRDVTRQLLRCTPDRKAVESCDISNNEKRCRRITDLVEYWDSYCSADKYKTYCPSWKSERSTLRADKKVHRIPRVCIHDAVKDASVNDHAEIFGSTSGCFLTRTGKTTSFKLIICSALGKAIGSTMITPYQGAGCYEYRCYKGRLQVRAKGDFVNQNRYLTCWAENATVRIRRKMKMKDTVYTVRGEITCPSCAELCEHGGFKCEDDVKGINTADFFDTRC